MMRYTIHLLSALSSIVYIMLINSNSHVSSNPIAAFDPTMAPFLAPYPPMPLQAPLLMGQHSYDPYASIQIPQYLFNPQHHYLPPPPMDLDRRSNTNRKSSNQKGGNQNEMSEEQKAMAGVPVSFVSIIVQSIPK